MNETNGTGRRLVVYAIPESRDGEKTYWPKIGAAFTNRDGSITLLLDALPLGTNKLQVREPRPPAAAQGPGDVRPPRREFETVEVHS
jgi:hypothetical protein